MIVSNPGGRIVSQVCVFLLTAVFIWGGCKQTSALETEGMVLGVAKVRDENASDRERTELGAEANGLKLLQLCHGAEFIVQARESGAVATTLEAEFDVSGVGSAQLHGADGYMFVKYDMPKSGALPQKFGNSTPEFVAISGNAEHVMDFILDSIAQRGGKMLRENGTAQGRIYVQVKNPLFKITEAPPTFRLELLMWIGSPGNQGQG